jgi:hypothetical protein
MKKNGFLSLAMISDLSSTRRKTLKKLVKNKQKNNLEKISP